MSKTTRTGMEAAVIGMAGRFPGARNIDEFWENLKNGQESITFFSDEELMEAGVSPALLKNPNYVKANGILEGFDRFDASFFGYIPSEAAVMAPQVRLFHECVWTVFENAGYMPENYHGRIGLYAGANSSSRWEAAVYLASCHTIKEPDSFEVFSNSQLTDKDSLTTRLSYKFNLTGPSFLIQTACSTSLVAVHLAVQGLINGECEMAVAGGAAVNIIQPSGYLYHERGILSPDGHNRAFDAQAKGTVAGDGTGAVVLKLLEAAEMDGDYIYAVIKGSAINNDGFRKVGYTAPSVEGQAQVISTALYVAEIEPGSIMYVETHGTGTELGDPVEIAALKLAFGNTAQKGSCALGSVKSNIGHLNNAAGIAGFIKTVLILKHGLIPPSLHYKFPNPKIDFENSPFYVNTKLKEWPVGRYCRRAGVSSFGIGGTNAHVIIEEYSNNTQGAFEENYPAVTDPQKTFNYLVILSAKTQNALEKITENLFSYLKANTHISLKDITYTLQVGRKHFNYRRTLVCSTREEALDSLAPENRFKTRTYNISTPLGKKQPVVFLFPGQGSQYSDMGLDLYRQEPLFQKEMNLCFEILSPLIGYDIKKILYPSLEDNKCNNIRSADIIDQTEIAQPLLFAFEYALARLLISWGIEPDAMLGHSIGEYTAACLAGVFPLEMALRLVALRGQLMQQMAEGAMLSLAMSEEQLKPLLTEDISLAAINSPSRCVVSGPVKTIAAFEAEIKGQGIECTRLHTSHAFHSGMMDPILESFSEKIVSMRLNKPGKPYISNLSGGWITGAEAMDANYWTRHLRRTVRFSDGIKLLLAKDNFVFIEVGPGNSLTTLVKQQNGASPMVNLVRRPKEMIPDDRYLLDKIGQLWLYGISIDWHCFYRGKKHYRIPLPTYPFEGALFPIYNNSWPLKSLLREETFELNRKPHIIEKMVGPEDKVTLPGQETRPERAGADILSPRPTLSVAYTAPQDPFERALADNWQTYFGLEKIGIYDDFFELGGDSLKAMHIIANIQREMNVIIPIGTFFAAPNINALAGYIRNETGKDLYISIKNVEEKEYYELSRAQKRLYIEQQEEPASVAYNLAQFYILEGDFDKEKLETSFRELIKRHESLRTSFEIREMIPVQRIHSQVAFRIEILESTKIFDPILFEKDGLPDAMVKSFMRPFNLSGAPLLRVGLMEIAQGKYLLMIDIHHIVSDGISMTILVSEFKSLYRGESLPGLELRYRDYVHWQNHQLSSGKIKQQEEYWTGIFSGGIPGLHLPLDYKREERRSFKGKAIAFSLGSESEEKLREIVKKEEITPFIFLLAIYYIFLFKITGQEDMVIGTVTAGRGHADLEKIIGMFVNTLALRNFPRSERCFNEFLAEVKKRTMSAFENQDYQFEDLVAKLYQIYNDRNPLFEVLFSFISQGMLLGGNELGLKQRDLKIRECKCEECNTMFDLVLGVFDCGEKIDFVMQYNTQLFKQSTIERFIINFKEIVNSVLENKNIRLEQIMVTHSLQDVPSNVYREMDFEF